MDGDVSSGLGVGCSPHFLSFNFCIAVRNPSLIAVSVSTSDLVRLPEHSSHSTCGEGDNSIISQVVFGRICGCSLASALSVGG
jgi:hypothetical protein